MTKTEERADELLLDWALAEASGASTPPDLTDAVRARLATAPRAGAASPWRTRAVAACVVLGAGVVLAVALQGRPLREARPAQDPAPAPEPTWAVATTLEEVAALPEHCRALRLFPARVEVVEALQRLQGLTHLDLGLMHATAEAADLDEAMLQAVAELPSLHELRLDHRRELRAPWLRHLAALPLLRTLSLRGVVFVGDETTPADPVPLLVTLPSLREVDLGFSPALDDAGLARLVAMPGLRSLGLTGCGRLSSEGLSALAQAKQLERLDLTAVNGTSPSFTGPTPPRHMLPRLERMLLTEMMLAAQPGLGVTDDVVRALAALPKLRELRLAGCPSLTAAGLAALSDKPLRALALTLRAGDAGDAVAALPPTLEELALADSPALQDADLEALAKRLPILRRLDLARCTGFGDDGLAALLARTTLTALDLRGCKGLSAASLAPLLQAKTLQELDVSGLAWVDADAEAQLRALPAMRRLANQRGGVLIRR